jgi:long-chain acyl-CoA synthetase
MTMPADIATRLKNDDLTSMFLATTAARGSALAVRDSAGRTELSYADLRERVTRIASGFAMIGLGCGDTVALMMVNRPEFFAVDLAALFLGAIPFSLYNSAPATQLATVLADAGTRVAVCDRAFVTVLAQARQAGAPLDQVIVLADDGPDGVLTLAELERRGQRIEADLDSLAAQVRPDDIATLIYTSGSTGRPKGVEITHANLVSEARAIDTAVPQIVDGATISVLPAAHIADRMRAYYGSVIAFGHEVTTVADASDLLPTLRRVRPVYFGNPPRTWEKMRAAIEWKFGGDVATRAGRDPGVGAEVRASLGLDRAQWISTGSAPTQADQFPFFDALGIRLCELWGMTETCSIATTNTPSELRYGTVGRAVDGLELRLAVDGELLARGATVATSYRNRPDQTAAALDDDGWFHTGDLAEVDADGFWRITGRKKELIINSAGKNMSPVVIESALKGAGEVIMQACVIGDRRPYNVALIVVASDHAQRPDPDLRQAVQAEVDTANRLLSRVEQVKRFVVLREEWLAGGDELTPTMKIRRAEIEHKYGTVIDELYAQ